MALIDKPYYHLVMTNSSPWKIMAHRNRWFTVLKNGWVFPWQTVSHNQRDSRGYVLIRWSPWWSPWWHGPWRGDPKSKDPDRFYDGESTTYGTILWYQDLSSPAVAWLSLLWLVARRSSWLSWFMDLSPKSSAMRQHFGRNGWFIMTRLPPPQIHGAEIG